MRIEICSDMSKPFQKDNVQLFNFDYFKKSIEYCINNYYVRNIPWFEPDISPGSNIINKLKTIATLI